MLLLPTNRPVPTEPKLGVIRTNTGTLIKPKLKKKNGKVCGYSNWTFGKATTRSRKDKTVGDEER